MINLNFKKGDVVGRISYGKDILFVIKKIIRTSNGNKFAILKGLTIRIEADAPIEDLELIEKQEVRNSIKNFDKKIEKRVNQWLKKTNSHRILYKNDAYYTGKILHLDGDSCLDNKNSH